MRYLSFLLLALPLLAAASPTSPALEARQLGKACSKSSQCGSINNYCRRGHCDVRKTLNTNCYKSIGCISGTCQDKKCVPGAVLTLGERCETSSSCASAYCGRSKCATKLPEGMACYKASGCLSGICADSKCIAAPVTPKPDEPKPEPTPDPPANNDPVDLEYNLARGNHFEATPLSADWNSNGVDQSDEVTTAKDGKRYVTFFGGSGGSAWLSQDLNLPQRRDELQSRAVTDSYRTSLWYRVPSYSAGSSDDQKCFLYFTANHDSPYSMPDNVDALPISAVTSEWARYEMIVESEQVIDNIQVYWRCMGYARGQVDVDWVSFVPDNQYGPSPGQGISNKGNLLVNGDFNSNIMPWTAVRAAYSTENPAYPDSKQKDTGHVVFTSGPTSQDLSSVKSLFSLYDVDGHQQYALHGGFAWRATGFQSRDTSYKCKLCMSLNGDNPLVCVNITPENVKAPTDLTWNYAQAAPAGLVVPVGKSIKAMVSMYCDTGASVTVAVDAISVTVDSSS